MWSSLFISYCSLPWFCATVILASFSSWNAPYPLLPMNLCTCCSSAWTYFPNEFPVCETKLHSILNIQYFTKEAILDTPLPLSTHVTRSTASSSIDSHHNDNWASWELGFIFSVYLCILSTYRRIWNTVDLRNSCELINKYEWEKKCMVCSRGYIAFKCHL